MRKILEYWYLWVIAVMLLVAIGNHPYSYYQLLRWVVCISAAYEAYNAYELKRTGLAWVFGAIAILFNPIAPITFQKNTWQIFDFVVAIAYFAYPFLAKDKKARL